MYPQLPGPGRGLLSSLGPSSPGWPALPAWGHALYVGPRLALGSPAAPKAGLLSLWTWGTPRGQTRGNKETFGTCKTVLMHISSLSISC